MKKLLSFLFLLFSVAANGQNYQCLQAGVKYYFTNGNGYLRGVRIDSVRTSGDTTIYYPFHTPRGYYQVDTLDPTGGSWLGKRVLQLSDGTFLFDNLWQDTIVIKTQANIGDSWIFCKDTSTRYYQATLLTNDTMSVLGAVDSVKKILITALDTSVIVATDPADSFQIIVSKRHGFVKAFDLYTFPYHLPNSSYTMGLDYYLDECLNLIPNYYTPFYIPPSALPTHNNSIFNLISFINPTNMQLYDWSVGDVYEYIECFTYAEVLDSRCDQPMEYLLDTIKEKNTTSFNTQYTFTGMKSLLLNPMGPGSPVYSTGVNSGALIYDTSLLVDTTIMPEENKQINVYYYYPDDTNYCMNTPLYVFMGSYLYGGDRYQPFFESSTPTIINKMQLGLIQYYQVGMDAGFLVNDKTLIYHYRDGQSCGNYSPLTLNVQNVIYEKPIKIFPNPANDQLTIQTKNTKPYTITLCNTMGQVIKTFQSNKQQETIDVSGLPAGLYYLSVIDENGTRVNNKVVIVH